MTSPFRSRARRARFILSLALPLATLVALVACGGKKGGPPGAGGPGGAMPPSEVTAVTVTPQTIPVPYEFRGRIEGSREVEVRARVSGILLERAYQEGQSVQKGATLFVIDPAEYRARVQASSAELEQAKAQLARADREAKRLEPLLAARAASRKAYDDAVSDVEFARAAVHSAEARLDQAKLDLSYTRVVAPISGLTSRAERSEGSLVGPGENGLLTRISQTKPIWVSFAASDQQMLALRKGVADRTMTSPATRSLTVELVLADGSIHPERGQVNFSDSLIDATTGSVGLRAQLPNTDGSLVPGQFVRVRLQGVARPNAIVVPQRAVLSGVQGKFVFVAGAENKAEVRPVVVGDWIGADWVIESGLSAGDRVLVDGIVKVRPGAVVSIVDPAAAPLEAPNGTPPAGEASAPPSVEPKSEGN